MVAQGEKYVTIGGFAGLNTAVPQDVLENNELTILENFDVGLGGELIKRPGWDALSTPYDAGTFKILGIYETSTFVRIIAIASNGSVYYTDDGSTWVLINTGTAPGIVHGLQYAGDFYILEQSTQIRKYDGSTLTTLTDSHTSTFGIVHKERLFTFNTNDSANSSRLRFSDIGDFASWPSVNFIDVQPGDGDYLVGAAILADTLFIFKSRTTWALYATGLPAQWVLRNISSTYGAVSKDAIINYEGAIYFSSTRGLEKTDGITFKEVSIRVRDQFAGRLRSVANLNIDQIYNWEDRFIFYTKISGEDAYLVYYPRIDAWSVWNHSFIKPMYFVGSLTTLGPSAGLYAADNTVGGKLLRLSRDSYKDAGATYIARFLTKSFDFELPHHKKRLKWMALNLKGNGHVDLGYQLENLGLESVIVRRRGTLTSEAYPLTYKIQGAGYFSRVGFELEDLTDSSLTVYSLTPTFSIKAKQSRTVSDQSFANLGAVGDTAMGVGLMGVDTMGI